MAPKSVTFRRHDHLVSVLFEDLLSHSYNITFSMFLDLVQLELRQKLMKLKNVTSKIGSSTLTVITREHNKTNYTMTCKLI